MRINRTFGKWAVSAVGVLNISGALAWGAAGHEIVATIAQMHLNPPVLPLLCSILYPDDDAHTCTLASVAAWADKIRYHARWSAGLHYVGAVGDHPSDTCVFPGDNGWAGREGVNVLAGIRNTSGILEDFAGSSARGVKATESEVDLAQEALKFLIHFVGDLHQPLHLTGRDRGGNGDKVSWDGRVTNLHSLWDGLLIAKSLRTIPANYSRPLPIPELEASLRGAIYDPYVRRIMWQGVGVGAYSEHKALWEDEVESWLDCPVPASPPPSSGWLNQLKQAVFSLVPRRGHPGPPQTTDDATLCPHAWAAPIHALNCDLVWPPALDAPEFDTHTPCEELGNLECARDALGAGEEVYTLKRLPQARKGQYLELDTPEYWGRIEREWVVEKLLAMGGIRLARVLNRIFAPLR